MPGAVGRGSMGVKLGAGADGSADALVVVNRIEVRV
jgi:hypothetical protein